MNCLVTAGPTFEPLDDVRRLTNSSTGRLGTELANYLTERGHAVTLLIGSQATWHGARAAREIEEFTTTTDLRSRLQRLASSAIDAVFHAAAVNDFAVGEVWEESPDGGRSRLQAGKISTRGGKVWAELVPTPKLIAEMRPWFPRARLVGWKFELDGTRADAIARARRQILENRTDACVANGRAYGSGFGLVGPNGSATAAEQHFETAAELYAGLEGWIRSDGGK